MPDVTPEEPGEAGVAKKTPDAMQTEGAEILANDAKDRLTAEGFTEDQISQWAETFIAEEGSGDVDAFVAWIEAREKGDG